MIAINHFIRFHSLYLFNVDSLSEFTLHWYWEHNFDFLEHKSANSAKYMYMPLTLTDKQSMCQLCPFVTGWQHALSTFVIQAVESS